jgi:predicted GIY-YIG superfamily endonuclease
MASKSRVLYIGMTGFLMTRVLQHKLGETGGFTQKHRVTRLLYFETCKYVNNAIKRETEINKEVAAGKEDRAYCEGQSDVGGFGEGLGHADGRSTADSSPAAAGSE